MVLAGSDVYAVDMADIFDVVADGTRRRLLQLLRERADAEESGEVSVGELVTALELSQPTVSKHLKVLRDHGLVRVRDVGQHRYYRLDPEPLHPLEEWLAPFLVRGGSEAELAGSAGATAFAAWAGADVGERVGRAAADTAHSARAALGAAQERIQGAQTRLERAADRLPLRRRKG